MALRIDSSQNRNLYVGTSAQVAVDDGNAIVTGKVGIGTTSPSAGVPLTLFHNIASQFHVGGAQAGISNNIYYNGSAWANRSASVGGSVLQLGTDGVLAFRTANAAASPTLTYRMYMNSSGNLGIGTTSPDTKLVVSGEILSENTNGGYFISTRVPSSSSRPTLNFYGAALDINYVTNYAGGGASTKMTILSGGNVGIGTTNPLDPLNVQSTGSNKYAFRVFRSTSATQGLGGFYEGSANQGQLWLLKGDNSTGVVVNSNGDSYFNGGNVGIGTDSPSYPLEIVDSSASAPGTALKVYSAQNSAAADGLVFIHSDQSLAPFTALNVRQDGTGDILNLLDGTTEVFTVIDGGNVGIGTDSPSRKLHVHAATGNAYLQLTQAATGTTSNDGFQISMGASQVNFINRENGNMVFETNNTERMRITSGGNVAFGSTSNLNSSNFQISTGSGLGENVSVFIANTSATPYSNTLLTTTQLGMGFLSGTANYVATGQTLGNLQFFGQANDAGYGGASIKGIVTTGGNVNRSSHAVALTFSTMSSAAVGDTERMRINSSGSIKFNAYNGTNNTGSPTHILGTDANGLIVKSTAGSSIGPWLPLAGGTMTGDLYLDDGAGATPSIYFKNGADNFWRYLMESGGNFSIKEGTSTRLTFQAGGNVGIGVTGPNAKFEVTGDIEDNWAGRFENTNSGGYGILAKIAGTSANERIFEARVGSNAKMLISGDGKVIINSSAGISGRTENFQVFGKQIITNTGTSGPVLYLGYNSSGSNTIQLGRGRTADGLSYMDFNGEVMSAGQFGFRIIRYSGQNASSELKQIGTGAFKVTCSDSADIILNPNSGNVGISQTNPSHKLDVTGNARFTSTVTASNFILSSDSRLKENIEKVCDNKVEADWKTFELKTDKGQKRYGVIAQELEKTNPEFVREDSQGFKSVAYIDLLIAKIAELEARLEKLEK